jgi:ribosomal protein S18 acetylase RimI-like enzyme
MATNEYSDKLDLIPASAFSYQELTDAYNQTRVDYLVPMPMNATRLREYVEVYDIDMQASAVAVDGNEILGLAMLGVREKRAWITRLGIIRSKRRRGAGSALVEYLINQARQKEVDYIVLEVIKDNVPAHSLFANFGFQDTRLLLVLRRPPGPPQARPPGAEIIKLSYGEAVHLLDRRASKPSWLDERESLINAGNLAGYYALLEDGSKGWLVYQNTVFQLGRLVMQTESGNPLSVGHALLYHLHTDHSAQDTKTENLPLEDPHWPIFKEMGYLEMFTRVEKILPLNQNRSI